jgi:hypothetical protein
MNRACLQLTVLVWADAEHSQQINRPDNVLPFLAYIYIGTGPCWLALAFPYARCGENSYSERSTACYFFNPLAMKGTNRLSGTMTNCLIKLTLQPWTRYNKVCMPCWTILPGTSRATLGLDYCQK